MNVAPSPTSRPQQQQQQVYWQLSGSLHPGEPPQSIVLKTNRFRIGRRPGLDLSLPSMQISGLHAELIQVSGRVFIRDLNSTNGTFVRGRRINHQDTPLRDGDQIRMGTLEFRLERCWADKSAAETRVAGLLDTAKPFRLTNAPTKPSQPNDLDTAKPFRLPDLPSQPNDELPKTAEVRL